MTIKLSCTSLLKTDFLKKDLFKQLCQVYFLMKIWRQKRTEWSLPEFKMLEKLLEEIHTDTFLAIEQSERSKQNASTNEEQSLEKLRVMKNKSCVLLQLFAQRPKLRELVGRYKREKVKHMQTLVTCVYWKEIKETIDHEHPFMCSQFGNYFNQPLLFRLSPEFGTLETLTLRGQLVQTLVQKSSDVQNRVRSIGNRFLDLHGSAS